MLFMVIERFRDTDAIGERFRTNGRMMPEDVTYAGSWLEPSGARCFQLMTAPSEARLKVWMDAWSDLMDFEVVPVQTSTDFWSVRGGAGRD
jgi:hypothetical protein